MFSPISGSIDNVWCASETMNAFTKFTKAVRDLGVSKLWLYGVYQAKLRSGFYRWVLPSRRDPFDGMPSLPPLVQFPQISQTQVDQVLAEADEVRRGYVQLFGGKITPLDLNEGASSKHWSILENSPFDGDIKTIWEPARFGWALTLARAYAFSRNPVYAQDFWDKTLYFLSAHPPNLGRQWQSAQEVAIRLMVLLFCDRVFAEATPSLKENRRRLWQAIAEHADRISKTLVYARAQNNNHLLAEAAGLFAASLYLSSHPNAKHWFFLGWIWLNEGLKKQINEHGTYVQQSTNYHRVMLQIALYADYVRREDGANDWPLETQARLAEAVRWLWALTDPKTGKAPNLGANDGAYLFPLTQAPFDDFRPVISAAARAFLGGNVYQQPDLTEMGDWFNLPSNLLPDCSQPQTRDMLRLDTASGRAFLRAAHFFDRPSHADQLHVDLWWSGVNIAADAGTYQYNAPLPWDNALAGAKVHNTLTIDSQDQMTRGGRFLWLDWAQAKILKREFREDGQLITVSAEHDGYKKLGVTHQRSLSVLENGWKVTDLVLPLQGAKVQSHNVNLVWLLPGWEWSFDSSDTLLFSGPKFRFTVKITGVDQFHLIREGQRVFGSITALPTWGWYSPTYLVKKPALTLVCTKNGELPIEIMTTLNVH